MKYLFIFGSVVSAVGFAMSVSAAEVTANRVLKRGEVLTKEDITITLDKGESLQSVHKALLGQQLKRTIYAGYKIDPNYLSAPVLVKRNAQVSMVYTYGTMQLAAKGRALEAGAMGETISIMNVSSRKKVLAVILAQNKVEVSP